MAARPAAARSSKSSKQPEPTPAQLKTREKNRRQHQKHRTKRLERMKERYQEMTPAERLLRNWRDAAAPALPRPGSARSREPRKVALGNAYCEWSDVEEVVRMHVAAAVMSELTGEQYVVDHAVPLSHPLVCGLHTHTNLQVVHWLENHRKGNWVWPDMWPISWESLEILESSC